MVREMESRAVHDVLNQLVSNGGGVRLAFSIVPIPDSEDWGTADSLRHLRGKLKVFYKQNSTPVKVYIFFQPQHSNVLVVSCDLVTSVPLSLLTEFHTCHDSTLTCLFSQSPIPSDDTHQKYTNMTGVIIMYLIMLKLNMYCRV